jgi:DNA-binding transcriptional MerR regulator
VSQIPDKPSYRANEVCQYADVQPYVLRFWESEFPQLRPSKGRSGQVLYSREDLELVLRIKKLLDAEEHTIADARRLLEQDAGATGRRAGASPARAKPRQKAEAAAPDEGVPRSRYDDAVEEIARLRLELKEAEGRQRRVEAALKQAREESRDVQGRVDRAVGLLEQLVRRIGGDPPESPADS